MISNAALIDDAPEICAIKFRVRTCRLDLDRAEVIALAKTICKSGYKFGRESLAPEQCWEVSTYIIEQSDRFNRPLDLRLFRYGFHDYLRDRNRKLHLEWKTHVESRMRETATVTYKGRTARAFEEHRIALQIHNQRLSQAQQIEQWNGCTGKSKAAYYRASKRSA